MLCAGDADQFLWSLLARADPDTEELAARLRAMGFTCQLYSRGAELFFNEHDLTDAHLLAGRYFFEEFSPMCSRKRFVTTWATLYEITRRQGYPRMGTGLPWAPVLPRRAEGAQGRLGRPQGSAGR